MSNAYVKIRYDGPALSGHQMDITDLAPALLGLSELCKLANRQLNGDKAAMQVFIGADQEQKCFQFNLGVVQTLWQHAQSVLENHDIKTAKEILEWLGLIVMPAGAGAGFFQLLVSRVIN